MRYIVYCHRSDLTFRHLSQSVCMCVCVWSLLAACVILEAALLSRSYLTIAPPLPPHSLRYKSINNLITAMHLRPSRRRRAIIPRLLFVTYWPMAAELRTRQIPSSRGGSGHCFLCLAVWAPPSCCIFWRIHRLFIAVQSDRPRQRVQPGHNARDGWRHRNVRRRLWKVQLARKEGLSLFLCALLL